MAYKDPEKRKAYQRAYKRIYRKTPKAVAYRKSYANRDYVKSARKAEVLKKKYNLTVQERDAILAKQGGVCRICKTDTPPVKGWCVDHDHDTKEVRSLLCTHCNLLLGHAFEDPKILLAAVEYLRQFGKH